MFFLESKSSKEMFEVIEIKLTFSSMINNSQQTSNFLRGSFFPTIIEKSNEIFSSDIVSIAT